MIPRKHSINLCLSFGRLLNRYKLISSFKTNWHRNYELNRSSIYKLIHFHFIKSYLQFTMPYIINHIIHFYHFLFFINNFESAIYNLYKEAYEKSGYYQRWSKKPSLPKNKDSLRSEDAR